MPVKVNCGQLELTDEMLSELAFHAGVFAHNAGDKEAAVAHFEDSLRLCPTNENTKNALAKITSEK